MKNIDESIKSRVEWVEIPKEDYDNAKETLSVKEFDRDYKRELPSHRFDKERYVKAKYPTMDELRHIVLEDMLGEIKQLHEDNNDMGNDVRTIKNILIFSLIVAIAGAIIFLLTLL